MIIHPIPPGLFCVPAALHALTGADLVSVIMPAINRHSGYKRGLLDTVPGARMLAAQAVLEELGYRVRPYKSDSAVGKLRAHLATWAKRSEERWPGRALLVATATHCLVLKNGVVHDTFCPFGEAGRTHPFAKSTIVWAALIEPPTA